MATTSVRDRYRFISRLGAGGFSTVHLAEDTVLGRLVALKRIHSPDDLHARSRLRREALIGASLSHPNLISVFDIVTTDEDEDVIVMEYVEGETLAGRMRRGERPDIEETLVILGGVASALDAIHAEHVVHRDVKPSNILLGNDGSVKLADLGIAAALNRTQITTAGAVMGTFIYMAPEQLEGATATKAVDIYALAAVAYELLTGERARHEDNPLALAHAIATRPPPDLRAIRPEMPAAAAEVLKRGMSRDPRVRPRSAGELAAGLRDALEPPRPEPRPVAPLIGVAGAIGRRRSRGALVAVGAMLLAGAAVAAIVLAGTGASGKHQLSANRGAHRASVHTARRHSASSSTPASSASAPTSAPPSTAAANTPSPVGAVESFYRLAASHQYGPAWALADPSFRQQMLGYQGLESTMAQERSITFDGASVVNQSPSSATVAIHTTSVRDSGTQNCSGTVNLVRSGGSSSGWLLDHIAISCV